MEKLKNEKEYRAALEELRKIFSSEKSEPEFERAQQLEIMIEAYEAIHHPID
jgi:HTH-type transcriptional regulator / antitoxin HigA